MKDKRDKQKNLSQKLKRLEEIAQWFENQDDLDVEEGLKSVKEAADLIKESKKRLKEVENEFKTIKKEITEEVDEGLSEGKKGKTSG